MWLYSRSHKQYFTTGFAHVELNYKRPRFPPRVAFMGVYLLRERWDWSYYPASVSVRACVRMRACVCVWSQSISSLAKINVHINRSGLRCQILCLNPPPFHSLPSLILSSLSPCSAVVWMRACFTYTHTFFVVVVVQNRFSWVDLKKNNAKWNKTEKQSYKRVFSLNVNIEHISCALRLSGDVFQR